MQSSILEKNLLEFIQTRVREAGAKGAILGLSGGVDSAVVATLCKRALDENVFALLMPSALSNEANLKDALRLCEELNLKHKIIDIQAILDAFLSQSEQPNAVRIGNFAARIRMSLLYDHSARLNFLVAGTSNKSELSLGYGTIYGDLACAFNPIGALYKSQIYELARHLNLNDVFITKPASADLWQGQSDEKELGFTYAKIDAALIALEKNDTKTLESMDKSLLEMIAKRKKANAFKLHMPIIAQISEDLA